MTRTNEGTSLVTANAINGTVRLTSVSDDYAYTGMFDALFDVAFPS